MKWLAVVLSFLLLSTIAHAQTFSVRCKFSDGQVTEFGSGIPKTIKTNDLGELVFDQIDVKKNSARFIGNSGAVTIKAFAGFESVHLIEATTSGNMNITTIFVPSNLKSASSLPVVHSRHVHALSGPLPSQYVGICARL